MNNNLKQALDELLIETTLEPIGISNRVFDIESHRVHQAHANTIIKLVLKNIDELEKSTNKLLNESLEIKVKLASLDNKLDRLEEKLNNNPSFSNNNNLQNLIGPKSFYPSKKWN